MLPTASPITHRESLHFAGKADDFAESYNKKPPVHTGQTAEIIRYTTDESQLTNGITTIGAKIAGSRLPTLI